MNIELSVENLPPEMKTSFLRLHEAIRRERKAREQYALWLNEFEIAKAEMEVANKEYGQISLRWNPTTNEMQSSREELKSK